jgi:hypothetical protein
MDCPYNSPLYCLQLFYTMTSQEKETMMYFGYTYAPNLTHQGASVITKKSFTTIPTMVEESTSATYQSTCLQH